MKKQQHKCAKLNRQVIIDSTSNVIIPSGKQPSDVLMQVNVTDATMRKRKVAYTVVIIVTVHDNPRHAFMAVRNKNHNNKIILWNCHHFVSKL